MRQMSHFAGVLAIVSSCAVAEAAQAETPPAQAAAQDVQNDPTTSQRDTGDIVVTAQRREERLSDVPMSVTALDSSALERNVIVSTSDLTVAVPGLNWGRSTNFNQPTIRGVGSRNASSGDEPNVATFVDGVYLPDMSGTLFELSNIERIEVLKGPQGTLFGRNATGGAINLVTRGPTATFEGAASVTAGSFGYYKVGGYLSGPIIAGLAGFSLTAVRYDDSGYVDNIYTGEKQGRGGGTAVRARLTITPSSSTEVQLNGFYSRSHNNVLQSQYALDGNSQVRNSIPGGPTAGALNPTGIPANLLITSRPYTTATPYQPFGKTEQKFLDGHFSWDWGFATLSAQASIGSTTTNNLSWTDNSPLELSKTEYSSFNDFSNEELVLTSNGAGRLNWLLGVTGFQSDAQFNPLISTGRSTVTGARATATFKIIRRRPGGD